MKTSHLLFLLILQVGSVSLLAEYIPPVPAARLVDSMTERLKVSREVAWAKFQRHSKINDPAREATVLSSLQAQGVKMGLSDATVARFFKPQFKASKRVQTELVQEWQSGRSLPTTPPKDLRTEIRPLVDKISREILLELKAITPHSFTPQLKQFAEKEISTQGFSWKVARMAAKPLGVNNLLSACH